MNLIKPPPSPPLARQAPVVSRSPLVTELLPIYKRPDGEYWLPMADKHTPAWLKVLRDCGYPETVVMLDLESYFDSDYRMGGDGKSLSTIEYVTDTRFEALGLARLIVNQPFPDYENQTHTEIGEEKIEAYLRYLQGQYGPALEGCTIVCHNTSFDCQVLARRYGIYPRFVIDTLGLARHWNSRQQNDLDSLTKQHKLPQKGDTQEFSGLGFRQRLVVAKGKKASKVPHLRPKITDEQVLKLIGYANNDVNRQWELFTILLPRLSNPKVELRLIQHTLELFTKPVLRVDAPYGAYLMKLFDEEIDKAVQPTGLSREGISGNRIFEDKMSAALEAAGESYIPFMKKMKNGPMLAIAKSDDQRDELLNHPDSGVRSLMQARVAVKSWPLHIARVERILRQAAANGGVLPVPLKYCGAHTARWSGGEKINLQNLAKYGVLAQIRQLLCAPDGMTLAIVDASQIEARVLAWIAGQWDLVEKFENDEEIYCGFASKVLGYHCRKPRKNGGIPAIEARYTWARNAIGKIGVLGCGYGMGQDKLFALGDGQFNLDMALKIRDTYRSENARIVQFWKDIEKAFLYTAKYQRPCSLPRGLDFSSTTDADVIITLPNGREIKYIRVKIVQDRYGDKAEVYNALEHKWEHIWGGTLTENVVQAMARDILAETILRVEDRGIHCAFHCHDEIVCPVPIAEGERALAIMNEEMSRVPDWAPRMPLGSEGGLTPVYRKL